MNSIIAYRNPLEQWFWEGGALYVLIALVISFILYLGYFYAKQFFCKHERTKRRIDGTHKCWRCDKVLGRGWVK